MNCAQVVVQSLILPLSWIAHHRTRLHPVRLGLCPCLASLAPTLFDRREQPGVKGLSVLTALVPPAYLTILGSEAVCSLIYWPSLLVTPFDSLAPQPSW
jgi:hypothetical protein